MRLMQERSVRVRDAVVMMVRMTAARVAQVRTQTILATDVCQVKYLIHSYAVGKVGLTCSQTGGDRAVCTHLWAMQKQTEWGHRWLQKASKQANEMVDYADNGQQRHTAQCARAKNSSHATGAGFERHSSVRTDHSRIANVHGWAILG